MDAKRAKTTTQNLSEYFTSNPPYDKQHPEFGSNLPPAMQKTLSRGSGVVIGVFISIHQSKTPINQYRETDVVEIAECTTGVGIRIVPNNKLLDEMKQTLQPRQIICINGHFLPPNKVEKFGLCFDAQNCQEFQTDETHPGIYEKYHRNDDFFISDLSLLRNYNPLIAKRLISCECQVVNLKGRAARVILEGKETVMFFVPKELAHEVPQLEAGTIYILKHVFLAAPKDDKDELTLTYTIGVSTFEQQNAEQEATIDTSEI